ncbi:collagen-binding domain-containing protein [Lactobacillus acetotolerans]|uniref:collagen-binding domain-containing protein n=1 Tax=Lactobacillus acetotolerans TaxID=1600 RepID=UPI001F49CDE6|nr:collagen-binding domain-containing protein [Lactobacillus acetotolerans]
MNGPEFGSRNESHNHTACDVYYIGTIDQIGANGFRTDNNYVILGDDSNVEFKGNQVYVNGNRLDHLKKEDVQVAKGYIDVKSELNTLKGNADADYLRGLNQSDGVIINSADMNNRSIDVSRAKDNQIVVNVDKDWLEAPQPITIKGLNSNANGPVVILNVQGTKNEVNWQTQIHLVYDDGSSLSPNEDHSKSNHVLWNFGNDVKKLNINGGYLMGSVLAPNSELTVNVNADGNLIADRVNIRGGESHRWDLWAPELVKHSKPAKPADTKPGKPDNKSDQHKPNHDDSKKVSILQIVISQLLLIRIRRQNRLLQDLQMIRRQLTQAHQTRIQLYMGRLLRKRINRMVNLAKKRLSHQVRMVTRTSQRMPRISQEIMIIKLQRIR